MGKNFKEITKKNISFFLFSVPQDEILCTTISHNNEQIVTGSRDRLIIVLCLETGEVEHSVEQHTDAIVAVALTQDDALLISG
jgi:WD40 repeat protein